MCVSSKCSEANWTPSNRVTGHMKCEDLGVGDWRKKKDSYRLKLFHLTDWGTELRKVTQQGCGRFRAAQSLLSTGLRVPSTVLLIHPQNLQHLTWN